jgi:hypothetical protein
VAVASNDFTPADLTVNPGDTVSWTNTGGLHNVRLDNGLFTQPSTPMSTLWTVSRVFADQGDFRYYCVEHGAAGGIGMAGIVRVTPSAPSPGPPPPGTPPPNSSPPGSPPPGDPAPGAPTPPLIPVKVTFRVTDLTPARGGRVRFFGSVRPALDGRFVLIQRRLGNGRFQIVARTRLRDDGSAKSKYGVRLRVVRTGVYRARVLGGQGHVSGTSRTRRLVVR